MNEDGHLEADYEDRQNGGGISDYDFWGYGDDDDDRSDVYEQYPAYADWE